MLAATVLAAVLCGCQPQPGLRLLQPTAPYSQREIPLSTDRAHYVVRSDQLIALLEAPLPGAKDGPPAFEVYLVLQDRPDSQIVGPVEQADARGFLIQDVGRLAGKSHLESGVLTVRRVWLKSRYRLEIDAETDDGARLVGDIELTPRGEAIARFERRRAADVAALNDPALDPNGMGATTRARAVE